MCGIAGFNLTERSAVSRTAAARILLAGIAERGADAAGYAYRNTTSAPHVHKQRSGASGLLAQVALPHDAHQLLVHVRDYTKGHPRIEANNHPVRHGAVVGVHNGIVLNDDEVFARHGWTRDDPEMTTARLDERRPELFLARGVGRPLVLGHGRHETFFASTARTLELLEHYLDVELEIDEVPEGTHLTLTRDGEIEGRRFRPDRYHDETPLPAVRAPHEGDYCLRILPGLV
jgi:glucosamine 6-phosphate synthetase-like amidotransferase/phosphosugar isomerase protein